MDAEIRNEIELTILRSAIMSPDRMNLMLDRGEGIFQNENYKKIFKLIYKHYEEGKIIDDAVNLYGLMSNQFPDSFIKDFIVKFSLANTTFFIEDLIQKLEFDNKINSIKLMTIDIYNGIKKNNMSFDEMVETMQNVFESINKIPEGEGIELNQMSDISLDDIFEKSAITKTGINEIDDVIHGIFDGQLFTIAARPGIGKTSLALQIAKYQKKKVLFFSLEMTRRELYAKLLSQESAVESWRIETNRVIDEDKMKVVDAHAKFKETLNIKLNDVDHDINKIMILLHKEKDIGLIVIDYLQLLTGGEGENRTQKISDITRRLKLYAHRTGTPIILLSQLNRAIEYSDREPTLSDLRESGSIEQDSDVVIFIHKNNFIFAKNRKGRSNFKNEMYFQKEYCRFVSREGTEGIDLVDQNNLFNDRENDLQ